jgi:Clostripain family/Bacterial pre-peptidase C-terminal domain
MLTARLVAILGVVLSLMPSSVTLAQGPVASWTVLVYLDGDNNLERDAINDFLEMASVGSSANVNVIVQLDRIPGYDSRYGDWTGTLRFRVTQGMTPEPANALLNLGEANMGDPQTLVDFITWGQRTFPAQRTAVVLWNHGDGWRTASMRKQERKAICSDDTSGRDALDMSELRQALAAAVAAAGAPLDLLAFDACLMAMIEVDAQVQPYARFRTASEETEPGSGYPFNTILADLQAHPTWGGRELSTAVVERYYQAYGGETQSAVDLGDRYTALATQVNLLAQALIPRLDTSLAAIQAVRQEVQQFYSTYVDLYHLAERLAVAVDDPVVRGAAQGVMNAVTATTVIERHGTYWPGAHGISIYFPAQASSWDNKYSGESNYLRLSAQTQWDEFLLAYLERLTVCTPDAYEPDNDRGSARSFVTGQPQRHNFCPVADQADWVAFEATAGQTYEIATSDLEAYCDTVLRLYDRDGQTMLAEDDDGGSGWASRITWTSPLAGTYYVQVKDYFGRSGQSTGYTLGIQQAVPPRLTVYGQIRLQGRDTFAGTEVSAQPIDALAPITTTTTTLDGTFVLTTTTPCTITAVHSGYLSRQWAIPQTTSPGRTLETAVLLGGDINADGRIDILDISFVGARFGGHDPGADINGDGTVDILDLVLTASNFGQPTL